MSTRDINYNNCHKKNTAIVIVKGRKWFRMQLHPASGNVDLDVEPTIYKHLKRNTVAIKLDISGKTWLV
jgi:hypothetical protein